MLANKSAEETLVEPVSSCFILKHSYDFFFLCWLFLLYFALMLITELIRVSLSFVFLTLGALRKYVLRYITNVFSVCVHMFLFCVRSGERVNGQH